MGEDKKLEVGVVQGQGRGTVKAPGQRADLEWVGGATMKAGKGASLMEVPRDWTSWLWEVEGRKKWPGQIYLCSWGRGLSCVPPSQAEGLCTDS